MPALALHPAVAPAQPKLRPTVERRHGDRSPGLDLRRPLAWPALAVLLLALVLFAPARRSPFIYLQLRAGRRAADTGRDTVRDTASLTA